MAAIFDSVKRHASQGLAAGAVYGGVNKFLGGAPLGISVKRGLVYGGTHIAGSALVENVAPLILPASTSGLVDQVGVPVASAGLYIFATGRLVGDSGGGVKKFFYLAGSSALGRYSAQTFFPNGLV